MKQLGSGTGSVAKDASVTLKDLENYKNVLEQTVQLSELLQNNFSSIRATLEKINSTQHISQEKIAQLKDLANSIIQASNSLGDEKTVESLKHLESIVVKR